MTTRVKSDRLVEVSKQSLKVDSSTDFLHGDWTLQRTPLPCYCTFGVWIACKDMNSGVRWQPNSKVYSNLDRVRGPHCSHSKHPGSASNFQVGILDLPNGAQLSGAGQCQILCQSRTYCFLDSRLSNFAANWLLQHTTKPIIEGIVQTSVDWGTSPTSS